MVRFILNNTTIETALPKGTLLLDCIRYHARLTGTKIGCREGDCGACSVLVGSWQNNTVSYSSATSCLMALGNADGKHIVTVEGTNVAGLNVIQRAFTSEGASQCGFCTPGFIVALAGYALSGAAASVPQAIKAIDGNICRCTGYKSIERALETIVQKLADRKSTDLLDYLIAENFLPEYFKGINSRMAALQNAHPPENTTQFNGQQPIERLLGGGTDLYVQQHDAMTHASIDFLFNKPALNGIWQQQNTCFIGAAATVADVEASPIFLAHFPRLAQHIKLVSSSPIRNMATIAGNLVNASPIGDFTVFLLALNATVVLSDGAQSRHVKLNEFYLGYKQLAKLPNEHVESIYFELPGTDSHFNFEKVCKRTHLDIASVNTAICLQMSHSIITHASLSAGGVGPIPLYLKAASSYLVGKPLDAAVIGEAIRLAVQAISPISDARGTAAYKTLLLKQLIKAHFYTLGLWQKIEQIDC